MHQEHSAFLVASTEAARPRTMVARTYTRCELPIKLPEQTVVSHLPLRRWSRNIPAAVHRTRLRRRCFPAVRQPEVVEAWPHPRRVQRDTRAGDHPARTVALRLLSLCTFENPTRTRATAGRMTANKNTRTATQLCQGMLYQNKQRNPNPKSLKGQAAACTNLREVQLRISAHNFVNFVHSAASVPILLQQHLHFTRHVHRSRGRQIPNPLPGCEYLPLPRATCH